MTKTEIVFTLAIVGSSLVSYFTGRAAQRADDRVTRARELRRLESLARARERGTLR